VQGSAVYERDRGWASLWKEICAAVSEDPAKADKIEVPNTFDMAVGTSITPPPPLPELIAAYALAGEPLELLVNELHPTPKDVDETKLENVLTKLQLYAAQLARLVRGGEVKQGSPAEGLSPSVLWAAQHIQEWRKGGMSDDDILELLRGIGREDDPELANLTREDVSRLGNLRPPSPSKDLRFP